MMHETLWQGWEVTRNIQGIAGDTICHICFKNLSLPHRRYLQLDVCRKRDIFISHSPQQKHTYFHCFFFFFIVFFFGATYTKGSHSSTAPFFFFCARPKYGCWVCCTSLRGAIHFKPREGHRVQTQRMTAMAEMTGVQPRFWAGIGPALVRQIIWSETMRPEWQMIHFECDCTALRAQTKRARG